MSDIHWMSDSMTLSWKMSCQPHVPILDIISIRILKNSFAMECIVIIALPPFPIARPFFRKLCLPERPSFSAQKLPWEFFFVKGHNLKTDKPWAMTGSLSYTISHDLLRPTLMASQKFDIQFRLSFFLRGWLPWQHQFHPYSILYWSHIDLVGESTRGQPILL